MRRHRADGEHRAVFLDAGEPWDLAQVDQVLGLREAKLHRGQETMPARQELGVVLETSEQVERLLDGAGRVVIELGWIHGASPFTSWISRLEWSARHAPA